MLQVSAKSNFQLNVFQIDTSYGKSENAWLLQLIFIT
jgi:hypothetical protein